MSENRHQEGVRDGWAVYSLSFDPGDQGLSPV